MAETADSTGEEGEGKFTKKSDEIGEVRANELKRAEETSGEIVPGEMKSEVKGLEENKVPQPTEEADGVVEESQGKVEEDRKDEASFNMDPCSTPATIFTPHLYATPARKAQLTEMTQEPLILPPRSSSMEDVSAFTFYSLDEVPHMTFSSSRGCPNGARDRSEVTIRPAHSPASDFEPQPSGDSTPQGSISGNPDSLKNLTDTPRNHHDESAEKQQTTPNCNKPKVKGKKPFWKPMSFCEILGMYLRQRKVYIPLITIITLVIIIALIMGLVAVFDPESFGRGQVPTPGTEDPSVAGK